MQKLITILLVLITAIRLPGCKSTPVEVENLDPLVHQALYDTTSSYYTDFSKYPKNIADLPIGIFGLGLSGAHTLDCTVNLDSFDNITGGENPDRIQDFAGEHIIFYTALGDADELYKDDGTMDIHDAAIKNTLFLVGDKCAQGEKERAKIVIAAGNITREKGLKDIRKMLETSESGVKVVGVVEEGVKTLLDELSSSPLLNCSVGLIADSLTIASGAYQQMVKDVMAERGLKGNIPVVGQLMNTSDTLASRALCEAFSEMIESHFAAGMMSPICAIVADTDIDDSVKESFQEIINNYRSKRINGNYPYRSVINDKVFFIDPSKCAAMECYRVLRGDNNLALRIEGMQVAHYTDLPM